MATDILSQYDPKEAILYALPDTGAVINVNTIPESVVDQLIHQYGGQGPLIGRKNYLQALRQKEEADAAAEQTTESQIQEQVAQRTKSTLRQELEELFGLAEKDVTGKIDRQHADQRSKLMNEEAVLGRLRSPASISNVARLDDSRNMALSNAVAGLAGQKAAGTLDVTKAIEGILAGEREGERLMDRFGQDLALRRDALNTSVLQAGEDRALKRYMFDRGAAIERDASEISDVDKTLARIGSASDSALKIKELFSKGKPKGG